MTWEEALSSMERGVPVRRPQWKPTGRWIVLVDCPGGSYVGVSVSEGDVFRDWHVDSGHHAPDLAATDWQEVTACNRYLPALLDGHSLREAS